MAKDQWNIYWNEYVSAAYLHGSEVIFHQKDDVEFRNFLMPPGAVIRQWYSRTNYQAQRIEPALPMIDGESTYQLLRNIDCDVDAGCLIRLIFYDRYEVEAGSLVTRDRVTDFQCPLKTYSYRMQLINGGVTSFRFHSIMIREITGEIL